jgi:hypothetical protein
MGTSLAAPQNVIQNTTQHKKLQSRFWVHTQKNRKRILEEIFVHLVHSIFIYNNPDTEAIPPSINRRTGKQNTAYTQERTF